MPTKICPKCGNEVDSVDLDKPADFYYCDCGWKLCDTTGWADRMADYGDYLKDQYYDR